MVRVLVQKNDPDFFDTDGNDIDRDHPSEEDSDFFFSLRSLFEEARTSNLNCSASTFLDCATHKVDSAFHLEEQSDGDG